MNKKFFSTAIITLCYFFPLENLLALALISTIEGTRPREKRQKNRDLVIFSLCIISKFVAAINPTFMCNKRRGVLPEAFILGLSHEKDCPGSH